MAAFENGGDTESAKRFNEGVKYQFEDVVGRVVARIAARSRRITAVVDEAGLQAEWAHGRGQVPSVCDWVLRADSVHVLIEATHHPVKASLAQGLAGGEVYDEDANEILTDRKFQQLASVMGLILRQGWSGRPQPDAIFVPIVVVPNSGTPSSSLSEMDTRTARSRHSPTIKAVSRGPRSSSYATCSCSRESVTSFPATY